MQQFHYSYSKNNIHLEQYIYKIGSYHYNWHRELELMTLLKGKIEVCSDGVRRILKPGDIILINSNKGHATLAHEPDSIAMVLHLDPEFFHDYYDNIEYLYFDCYSTDESRNEKQFIHMRAYLSEMILSYNKKTPELKLLFESAFYSLLHTLVLHFPPKEVQATAFLSSKNKFDTIEKIVKYIAKNYKEKITLDDLGKISQYNPNYVSQLFKSHLGINFYDYLTRIRLRIATQELASTEKPISEVALSNGFSDIKAFNSAFKSSFGKTPTEYRNQLNEDITKNDITFKQEFISFNDERVNNTLMQYVVDKNSYYLEPSMNQDKSSYKETLEAVKAMSDIAINLNKLGKDLKLNKDQLDKIIWTLSE